MTTYALSFELRPDSTPTAPGASDFTRCRAVLNGSDLGLFVSDPQGGASCNCAAQWKLFSVDVSAIFDPLIDNHLQLAYVASGVEGNANDRAHWRRIRIDGSDGSVYFGEYPAGFPYTAALQDGIAGSDSCGGSCLEMASHGDDPANEWNAQTSSYVTPVEGTGSIHLYFSAPDVPPVEPPPSVAELWDVYAAADPNGPILETLTHAYDRQFRAELNGTGSGSFKINRHAAEATAAALQKGNIVKVRIPAIGDDYIFAFILEHGDFTLLSTNEEGGEELEFGGRGVLAYLDRAVMWDEAFTTGLDISDTWTEIWEGAFTWQPVGTAFLAATPGYVYAIGRQTKRIYKIDQTTHKVVAYSPVLWSGSTAWAGGLSADPADANVMWALEAPWAGGFSGHTKIRKIDISGSIGSWNVAATHDLGSAIQLSAIKADSSNLWVSRYDSSASIQRRSKTTGSVNGGPYTIVYGGVTQTKAVGISVNGSNLAYWFSGTKRALIAAASAPSTITDKISTQSISAFGGDWSTESSQDYFYMDSYTAGRVWKYQITAATPHDPVDGIWRLDEGTPGAILWRLMQEWQAAGRPQQPLPDATYVFTSADDSDGDPWATHDGTLEYDARIGDGGVETALRLVPYGLTVQMAPNLELGGYNSFGSNRSGAAFGAGVVRFQAGVNIVDALSRRLDERQADSHLLVGGNGNVYVEATDDDLGYVREGFLSTDLQDATAMAGTGAAELAREREIADSVAFAVLFGDDEAAGTYLPGPAGSNGHYWLGDTVRLHTGTGPVDFDEDSLRVYAITLTEQANGTWKPLVELTSPFLLEPTAAAGSSSGSSSGTSIGGTGTAGSPGSTAATLKVTDGADISIPGVTTIQAAGAYSPSPGLAVIPIPESTTPLAEELLTDATSPTAVLHPDGGGGAEFEEIVVVAAGAFELTNEGGQPVIKGHGSMGSTETFDPTDGNVHTGTLNANCTVTLLGPADGTRGCLLELWLIEDSTGGWTVTWPGSVTEQGTHDTTASTTQRVILETIDGGTNWIATWIGGSTLSDHTHAISGTGATGGGGTLTPAVLVLPAATGPAETAEGSAVWDSDDDKLTVGTGAGRKTMVNEGPATSSGLTQATARLLGRTTAGTGAIEEIAVGSGLSLAGGSLSATGTVAALDDLTDVVITSPALAQFLRYSGSAWVNAALVVSDYPYHDEVLCDSSGPILDSHGDVVMVTGVPN